MTFRRLVQLALIVLAAAVPASAALQLPPNVSAEASHAGGTVVTFSVTGGDGPDDHNGRPTSTAVCAPASGSLFPLGTTTVNCTAADGATGSFSVTVVDTTAPAIVVPRDFAVRATSADGALVTFSVSASDTVDGNVAVACMPESGSVFPLGVTRVECSAGDSRANRATASFSIEVTPPISEPPPPSPKDITAEATGPDGAIVTFGSTGSGDDHNGRPISTCAPASGSRFPLGTTRVQCGGGGFNVIVVDTTAPQLFVPAAVNVTASDSNGATVLFDASADDLVDGSVAVACAPPSGTTFPVGQTTVVCTAADGRGNDAMASFVVTVTQPADTEAPVFLSITAAPDTLKPPNGGLVEITLTVDVTDNTDPAPLVRIYDVTANELIANDDWAFSGPLLVSLRATRAGSGTGRIYTVHVEAIDASGNRSTGTVEVSVPHDASSADSTIAPASGRRRAVRP